MRVTNKKQPLGEATIKWAQKMSETYDVAFEVVTNLYRDAPSRDPRQKKVLTERALKRITAFVVEGRA